MTMANEGHMQAQTQGPEAIGHAKSDTLGDAIIRQNEIVRRLHDLRSHIIGEERIESEKVPEPARPQYSLQWLLTSGPEELKNSRMKAHEILEEIEALLF